MEEPVPSPRPPVPAQHPTVLTKHGDTRIDPYFWLRQRANPEVVAYLEAENEHTDAAVAPTAGLQERLYQEIVARIQQTDVSPTTFFKGWWHYVRTVEGLDYEIHCRRMGSMEAPEEVELDVNELARGHDYFDLGFVERSPDENILAYAVDVTGNELHQLRYRDLTSGRDLEDDERFELSVEMTKSERYIIFTSSSQVTSESRYLPTEQPEGEPMLIEARRHGIEYSADHQEDLFLILTNDGARNFRLMAAPLDSPGRERWRELVPERAGVRINAIDVHAHHVVLGQRSDGLQRLEVLDSRSGEIHIVDQPDPAYTAFAGSNPVYESTVMRFFYTSLNAPWSTFDYDMNTRERTLVKEQPVPGGYNRADYVADRLWATAPDGVLVPLSIVYRRGLLRSGTNPTMLYGYGAYEIPSDPMFDAARISLLDRGFVFAIAHVRGGGEMGREWYEDGKFLCKTNTFDDFIACALELIKQGYTNPRKLSIRGRSAGGLLIGAVLNSRPDLFGCAVAQVPFVDVLTTMLDESIPLTVNEYEEWGDPNDPEFYEYMKSYSPYDNVHRAAYPATLVTAGLSDTLGPPDPPQDRPRLRAFGPIRQIRIVARGGVRLRVRGRPARGGRLILTSRRSAVTLSPISTPTRVCPCLVRSCVNGRHHEGALRRRGRSLPSDRTLSPNL